MGNWLKNIDILELSLVRRPANKRRAIVRKSEESMEKLSEEQRAAVMAALDALESSKDLMGEEAHDAAASALAMLMQPDTKEAEQDDPMGESVEEDGAADAEEASGSDSVEEEKEEEEKEEEKSCDEVNKSEELQTILKSKEMELEDLRKSLASREEEILQAQYTAKAEALSNVPMATSELSALIRLVDDAGNEGVSESLGRLLSSVNELTQKSDQFAELGGSGEPVADRSGVMGKIEALADGIIEKSAMTMTREQAIARVLENNPALYTEWVNQG